MATAVATESVIHSVRGDQALGQLDTVFLDKTGTLTFGFPVVSEIHTASGISRRALLEAATSAERSSEHPLGRAIVRFGEQQNIPATQPESFEYRIGQGVIALVQGEPIIVGNRALLRQFGISQPEEDHSAAGTEVLIARSGLFYGSILVTDELRPSAAPAVKALADMDINVVLLTGDSKAAAKSVADLLGIAQVYSELLPEQKTAYITEKVRRGSIVAMLGDGINDAPALSEATVGVAMALAPMWRGRAQTLC